MKKATTVVVVVVVIVAGHQAFDLLEDHVGALVTDLADSSNSEWLQYWH